MDGFLQGLIEGIKEAFWTILNAPWIMGQALVDAMLMVPGVDGSALGAALEWLAVANYWFPVGESFAALGGLWTFQVAFIASKLSLKLIPTVG